MKSQIGTINQYFSDFKSCGISGMNINVLIQGRCYGGCSFLYRKSLSADVTCIDMNGANSMLCTIRNKTSYFVHDYNDVCQILADEELRRKNRQLHFSCLL